jgi:hypothetical protein
MATISASVNGGMCLSGLDPVATAAADGLQEAEDMFKYYVSIFAIHNKRIRFCNGII